MFDVRTWHEYREIHIEGARSMPLRTVDDRIQEIPPSGLVVFYTTTPERDRRAFPHRTLDERVIRGGFDMQVQASLTKSPSSLFDMPDDDVAEVLYRTERMELVRDVFNRALHERPHELARVLGFAVKLGTNSADPDDVSVFSDDLVGLHKRVDLEALYRVTERLPTEYWEDRHERALVHYFRKRYKDVVARAAPEPPAKGRPETNQ